MAAEDSLQFLKLDYASHRDALLQRVRARWPGVWNDFLANSFGRVLIDLVAWSQTILAYTIHRVAAENFLPTMQLRESAVRLGAFCGYQLRQPGAASVLCEAAIAGGAATDANVTLAKGTVVPVGDLVFELGADYVIAQGASTPESLVLTVAASRAGSKVLQATFAAVAGKDYLDLSDPTVDLSVSISAGQVVKPIGSSTTYRVQALELAPGAALTGRVVLDRTWEGVAGPVEADIVDRRVLLVQGQTFSESFSTPSSPGGGLLFRLARTPVIQNSIKVKVNQVVWPVTASLAVADSLTKAVETKTLLDGNSAVVFGDDLFGAIPPGEARVSVSYRVGGGTAGNVPLGAVASTVMGRKNQEQIPVSIVNNTAAGQGGLDQESLPEARANIPAHIKANDRGVTALDYEALASRYSDSTYGTVRYARALSGAKNPLLEGNIVQLYAWTTGPGGGLVPLSPALKRGLQLYLQTRAVGTDLPVILDGTSRPAPMALRYKILPGSSVAGAQEAILNRLASAVTARKPGEPIIFSNLLHELDALPGVDSLNFATPVGDLEPATHSEVFTAPGDAVSYAVPISLQSGGIYVGQSPVTPLQAWAFRAFLDGEELMVLPDHIAGRARLVGTGLAKYEVGLLSEQPSASSAGASAFYYATNTAVLYKSSGSAWAVVDLGGSWISLITGQVVLSAPTTAGALTLKLNTATGYEADRVVDIFVGYGGQISQVKRQEVRAAIKSFISGLAVGGSLFAEAQRNNLGAVTLASSRANLTDAILSVAGVTSVNQVSLESASASARRIDATATEIFRAGAITINGFSN